MSTRATVIRSAIRSSQTVQFRILTNDGQDIDIDRTSIELSGDAPTNYADLAISINGEETRIIEPGWSSPTRWSISIDLVAPENEIRLYGLSRSGAPLAGLSIDITSSAITGQGFLRGDANDDGLVEVGDVVTNLLFQFRGLPVACEDALDADDSGVLDTSDAVYLLDFLFRGGDSPPAPFPRFGFDPSDDVLECSPDR